LAEGSAQCEKLMAEEGDRVEAGDVLAELEKDEAQASYRQTLVQVKQNEASYEVAKGLYEDGLGNKVDMDNALFTLEQSKANLETQRLQIENLTVRAPISGVVTQRNIQKGMFVNAGNPVFTIVDPGSYVLPIAVPEQNLPNLDPGQQADVRIDAIPGKSFQAQVRRIHPSADESGTVKVLLDFQEEDKEQLRDMLFARIRLVMETHENVLLVQKDAVLEENGRSYMFLVRRADEDTEGTEPEVFDIPVSDTASRNLGGLLSKEVLASAVDEDESAEDSAIPGLIAERVEVEIGLDDSESVEIVEGLTENDLFVTKGQHNLEAGDHVRVTNITDEIAAKAQLTAAEALAAAEDSVEGDDERGRRGRGPMRIHVD